MELTMVGARDDKRDMGIVVIVEVGIEGEFIRSGDISSAALDPPALATFTKVEWSNWVAGANLDRKSVGGIHVEEFCHCDRNFYWNALLHLDLASTDRALEVGMRLIIHAVVVFFDSITIVDFKRDAEACTVFHCDSRGD